MNSLLTVVSRHCRVFACCAIALFALCTAGLSAVPAFPGAEGFGAQATGGRGGSVYVVTNLNDTGPGSFRDAVSQPNRYVVFAVGGVIKITSRIVVKNNITIAGQTAPGEGITIYGNGLSYTGADNTITRYIRIRMGVGGDSGKDAVAIARGHDMMFDHVTVSWGRDETFSISPDSGYPDPSNITIQDSMIAMGLQTHSAGGLIQTDGGVSIIRCLYIDNHTRNPKVKGVSEFTNNIVYNWGGGGAYILGDSAGQSYTNIVNNYFIEGPNSSAAPFTRGNLNFHVYASDNFHDSNRNGVLDGAVIPASEYTTVDFQSQRYPYPAVSKLLTPAEAYAHVAANAGASKARDRVDRRYIEELTSLGTLGQIPTNENDAPINGAGPVVGGTAPVDTDLDGMPDAWELSTGTNPAVQDHNGDLNGDGYTNLEEYLNALASAAVQGVAFTGVTTDSGASGADAVTSDNTIILNGTAEAGSTVTITRIGTGVIGTAVAGPTGAWSLDYTGTALPDGIHPFTAVAVTPGGWTTPPTPAFVVTVDNAVPVAPQIASTTLVGGNLVFNGSSEPGATITVSRLGVVVATATADNSGLWSATYSGPALAPGVHTFTAAANDRAGNASSDSAGYTIDCSLVPPAFSSITTDSGALANDLITNDTTLLLNGTGPVGATVSITRAGIGLIGTATVGAGGTWTFDYTGTTLAPGAHTFAATSSNGGVSSTSSSPFVITVDTTRPVVSSITRLNPITAANVASTLVWRVTFAEPVSGVDSSDFALSATGASGTIASVSASSGTTIDVTVNNVAGDGTLRLDLKSSGTGIVDVAGNAINTGFTSGQSYTVRLPGSGVWISSESGDLWSDSFSWEAGTIADGVGATADFATHDLESDITVQLDSARTLGRLIFGDTVTSSAASWTIESASSPLTLATVSGTPSLVVNSLGSGATANLAVGIASANGLAKSGSGTAVLSGTNAVSGPLSVTAGTLRVANGGTLSNTTVAINNGGARLEVADGGTYDASGLVTITAGGSSGIVVSGGVGNFNGGIVSSNTRDARVLVTGGVLNATSIDFPRSNDASVNYAVGLVVQGGAANIGTVILGSANSWGTASFEGGLTTVSGPLIVGSQAAGGARGGHLRVTNSGTLIVSDTAYGLVLSRSTQSSATISSANFLGGVGLIEKITMGYDGSSTGGSATLNLNGGALYLGSGGIVKNGTFSTPINLTKGTLGALASWTSALPMTLTGTPANLAFHAGDRDGNAGNIVLSGELKGAGGFSKTGSGILTLAGSHTYAGETQVNAGTLRVTGSLSASGSIVAINDGAVLAGNGGLNRAVVLNENGTLAPDGATSVGTLSAASLVWNGGGVFAVDLGATGESDGVSLSGALTKGEAGPFTVAFAPGAGFAAGNTYTLATFASTDFAAADFAATGLPSGTGALFQVTESALQVRIQARPSITSATDVPGMYGAALAYMATSTELPVTFGATGLPPGVTIDPLTGIVSGTPTAAGLYAATITATNTAGMGQETVRFAIAKAPAVVTVGTPGNTTVRRSYDGSGQSATITTEPAGLNATFTYDGSATAPSLPGVYDVVATLDDPNYSGTATGKLVITITALVRRAPHISGTLEGSFQMLTGEDVKLNGSALVSGDLLVPGMPDVRLNGAPVLVGIKEAGGSVSPADYEVTLNGGAMARYVVRRVDAICLPVVSSPQAPAGTRNVALNRAADQVGDFATVRNLTVNGNVGAVTVPAGVYGDLTVNGANALVLGVAGATEPAVYELQRLTLNGSASLRVVGPVLLRLANGVTFNSGVFGSADVALVIEAHRGDVTLNGAAKLHAEVIAPSGAVTINGSSELHGRVSADHLTINGDGVLTETP